MLIIDNYSRLCT